jgi:hypothetical protein
MIKLIRNGLSYSVLRNNESSQPTQIINAKEIAKDYLKKIGIKIIWFFLKLIIIAVALFLLFGIGAGYGLSECESSHHARK